MTTEEFYKIAEHFNYKDFLEDITPEELEELKNTIKYDFYYNILGLCGCGNPARVGRGIYNYLTMVSNKDNFKNDTEEYHKAFTKSYKWIYKSWQNLTIAYMLDNKGLTEHGTSIGSCWITELGKMYLKIFDDKKFNFEEG